MGVQRLSHSSLNTYAECGERWRLERIHDVPRKSWFATVAGSAVHTITEYMDLDDLFLHSGPIPTFKDVLDEEIERARLKGETLRVSGPKRNEASMAGGPNKKDYDWWLQFGPVMLNNWRTWRDESDWTIAMMPDGKPGIEVALDCEVAGKPFRGFIDRVFRTPSGQLVIVDLKTGTLPLGTLQLSTYAVGLERQYGLSAEWGAYWSGQTGELSYMKDLTGMSQPLIDHLYEMAWRGIDAGVFLPSLSSNCRACGVNEHCRYWGGDKAETLPLWDPEFYLSIRV